MKIITTFICIMGFQYIALCQAVTPSAVTQNTMNSTCSVIYSENSELLVSSEQGPFKCREITIMNIPPSTQSVTPLNIEFGMTGSFTFKKDGGLEPHENVDVYIEDMLTGKVFDLKTSDSYTFNVTRRIPGRFVLHMDKMLDRYAVSLR